MLVQVITENVSDYAVILLGHRRHIYSNLQHLVQEQVHTEQVSINSRALKLREDSSRSDLCDDDPSLGPLRYRSHGNSC